LVLLLGLERSIEALEWTTLAAVLALAIEPVVERLHRWHVPRWASTLALFALGIAGIVGMARSFVPLLVDQVSRLAHDLPSLVAKIRQSEWFHWIEVRVDLEARMQQRLSALASDAAVPVLGVAANVLHVVFGVISVVVLTIFMVLFGRDVVDTALKWVDPAERGHWRALLTKMRRAVGGYVLGLLLLAVSDGAVMGLTMRVLGVPYYLPLGLLTALLVVIPFVGITIAGVLIVATTFATQGVTDAWIALAVLLVYQQIENHVLIPLIQRRTIRMNPLLIALALLFGTAVGGLFGAVVALPAAGVIQVVAQDALARRQKRRHERDPDPPRGKAQPARSEWSRPS
jgi:predicted PurR-regulated permease PerM